jgi:hypothetical protein
MIIDLQTHPEPYVTMSELADYWRVSRKQIDKQIEAGTLRTTLVAPRLRRIRTLDAIRFEETATVRSSTTARLTGRQSPRYGVRARPAPRSVMLFRSR